MVNDANDRVLDDIEDYTLIEDFVLHLSRRLREGTSLPSHIPSLHNTMLMDALSSICEHITKLRKGLL